MSSPTSVDRPAQTEVEATSPSRGRSRLGIAAVVVVAFGVAGVWLATRGGDEAQSAAGVPPTATAKVERRDLVERETFPGTLGYDEGRPVVAQQAGTITMLPDEGSTVTRGRPLYRVDSRPVTLMYGAVPAFRQLDSSVSDGADVRQLEQNLVALGYDEGGEMSVDEEWTSATTEAVERWQEDRDLTVDGAVDLGEVVFLPGARRIGAHKASVGSSAQPGVELLATTSTKQIVTVPLEADRQDLIAVGDRVTVELPGGRKVAASVMSVGTVARSDIAADGTPGDPLIDVKVTLTRASGLNLDQAPVDVDVTKSRRNDVLTVPVVALVALPGGGHGIELTSASGTQLVPVETGTFADGFVEITGDVKAGSRIVVPS